MSKVAFIHPDLGIGGAERLILDAAKAVEIDRPDTTIWTCHFDKGHCFKDAPDHKIEVRASWIPRNLFGFGHIFFSLLSNLILTICCALRSHADIFIVDQISAWVPLIRFLCPKAKVIFYCHFPDLFLAPHTSLLRRIYRFPFDFIEGFGLKRSHLILVNSSFTASVVAKAFKITTVEVLYPCVDCSREVPRSHPSVPTFVSLNRYERKKDHGLAIKALADAKKQEPSAKLVIAGGYDERVIENVEHYKELQELVHSLDLDDSVQLIKNISDDKKWELIGSSTAMIYTPQREHFGIVPLEALSAGVPVIACNSGGPCETVSIEGCFLCEPKPEAFAEAMIKASKDIDRTAELKAHAKTFGFDSFATSWKSHIEKVTH